jgi:hypothetical protein
LKKSPKSHRERAPNKGQSAWIFAVAVGATWI